MSGKRQVHKYCTTREYRKYRARLLRELNYTCERCGLPSTKLEIHHPRPLFFNKDDDRLYLETWRRSNQEVLCHDCHNKHTRAMMAKYGAKARGERPKLPGQAQWDDLLQRRLAERHDTQRSQPA